MGPVLPNLLGNDIRGQVESGAKPALAHVREPDKSGVDSLVGVTSGIPWPPLIHALKSKHLAVLHDRSALLPNSLFEHAWPGMVIWGLLYISDYALTITCARLYGRQGTVVLEGSYEITPFFQRDINSLRIVSPRFVFVLLLTLGILGFLWILNESSPAPELYEFTLGVLIAVQLAIHMRHLRNLVLFRSINKTDLIRGRIEYGRMAILRASSWEWFAFSSFFLMLFLFTGSWFILGGVVGCIALGVKHRKLAGKLRTNLAKAAHSPQQTGESSSRA